MNRSVVSLRDHGRNAYSKGAALVAGAGAALASLSASATGTGYLDTTEILAVIDEVETKGLIVIGAFTLVIMLFAGAKLFRRSK